jgi:hypothetical protein
MTADRSYHWSDDPYWTEALDGFCADRDAGATTITLDIKAIEEVIFNGNGPAYRLMDAMASVLEHEGMDGCRGAPRLTLALLHILKNLR